MTRVPRTSGVSEDFVMLASSYTGSGSVVEQWPPAVTCTPPVV